MSQTDLFGAPAPDLPAGFRYRPEAISRDLEQDLLRRFEALPFEAFDFHGFKGHRRVISYGWRYDFSRARVEAAEPLPDFLKPVQTAAADVANVAPEELVQVLINQYAPGAGIGWHFGDVFCRNHYRSSVIAVQPTLSAMLTLTLLAQARSIHDLLPSDDADVIRLSMPAALPGLRRIEPRRDH